MEKIKIESSDIFEYIFPHDISCHLMESILLILYQISTRKKIAMNMTYM
ncbi:hypothetical protein RHG39_03545 [Clostridioides difficile]|nr:hypothetical protein [Clostridioides difficile]